MKRHAGWSCMGAVAMLLTLAALEREAGAEPLPSDCGRNKTCQVSRVKATAPQGTAGSFCLAEGGTGATYACLGGYPGAGFAALFLGQARSVTTYTLRDNGTSADLNGVSAINFRLGGTAQWGMNGTELRPTSDNSEDFGTAALRPRDVRIARDLYVSDDASNPDTGEPLTVSDAEGFALVGVATGSLPACNSTAPPTGTRGTTQYDTTTNQLKLCDGTAWQEIVISATSDGAEVSFNADHAADTAGGSNVFTVSGLTGLTLGSFCQVSFDATTMPDGYIFACKVISTTQVAFTRHCVSASNCDAPSSNYYARITKR